MFTRILADNILLALVVWAAVYAADYYLTIIGARLYYGGINGKIVIEGSYELTPEFQRDVDRLRIFSPHFALRWIISLPFILLVWLLAVQSARMPELFAILMGALLLREAAILCRHVRNLFQLRYAMNPDAIKGRIEYSRCFSLKVSAVDHFEFAAVFLLVAIITQEWFFAGGALGCAILGGRHWSWANKLRQPERNEVTP